MSEQAAPTGETAVVIVPPHDICGFADHYRRLYMPDTLHRIPPHITLAYPFVPFDELEAAMPRLADALAACPPRAVAIRGFSVFQDAGILYLHVANEERVLSLHQAIMAEFPDYPVYGGRLTTDFVPHITVGNFPDPDELDRVYQELSGMRLFLSWDVECVQVMYKDTDGIWQLCAEIPLAGAPGNC
ncbi:MAG TPA: 2'-5' RNA ligase family protein [Chloroflexia bacterium]|nr:2'-5' RNA ligase family protein [Chloroflexia bacterium]